MGCRCYWTSNWATNKKWEQANLPVHMQGVEVRSVACWQLQPFWLRLQQCSRPKTPFSPSLLNSVHGEEDPSVKSAMLVWTKTSQSTVLVNALKHIKKAWNSPMTATVYQKLLADSSNTSTDATRLRAVASAHAKDWLHAATITAVGLRLSNEAIRVAVSHRLGSTTWQHHTCICEAAVDANDYMDSPAGRVLRVKYVTHNWTTLCGELLKSAIPGSEITSWTIAIGWQETRRSHAHPMDKGQASRGDVTIPNKYAHSYISDTATTAQTELRKQDGEVPRFGKNSPVYFNCNWTGGAWNEKTVEFITEVGIRITEVTKEKQETRFLFRIPSLLHRGNAIAFRNTFSSEH